MQISDFMPVSKRRGVCPKQTDRTTAGRHKAEDDLDNSGFARAVRPNESNVISFFYFKRHFAQHFKRSVAKT